MNSQIEYLREYLRARPLFLSVLRAKEAYLYRDYLPFKKPVLDYGCGDGFFAKIAFSHENTIDIGLDVRQSRINQTKKQKIYKKTVNYDGKKIPFGNNHFATVVSNSVLEHVDGLEEAIAEINRVLKPGGTFLTTVMTNRWEDYLWGAKYFGNYYKIYMRKKQIHVNLLSRKEWDRMFAKKGFKIKKTVGHLDRFSSGLIDFLHYLSVPSLISYKLST